MNNVYFIGICGTAMATLAAMLKQQGLQVSGSDAHAYPPMDRFLAAQGITPLLGYDADHLTDDVDVVVIGNAVSRGNPEVEAVLARRMRYVSLPEMVRERFLWNARPIVVAGTHGKTTTTSMTAWALVESGADPGFLVGGIPAQLRSELPAWRGRPVRDRGRRVRQRVSSTRRRSFSSTCRSLPSSATWSSTMPTFYPDSGGAASGVPPFPRACAVERPGAARLRRRGGAGAAGRGALPRGDVRTRCGRRFGGPPAWNTARTGPGST